MPVSTCADADARAGAGFGGGAVADRYVERHDEAVFGLEMVVLLGVALVACGAFARRYPIAPAILLVLVGVLLGFAPRLRQAQLPPEVVLLLFLPALLYWES